MARKRTDLQALAELAHCTPRTIANYESAGIVKRLEDGSYDALAALSSIIKYRRDDTEAKRAKTTLAQVEAKRKELAIRKAAGELVSRREVQAFTDIAFDVVADLWRATTSRIYTALPDVPERERLVLVNEVHEQGLGELFMLRQRFDLMLKALHDDLRDERRVDALMASLGEHAEPPAQ